MFFLKTPVKYLKGVGNKRLSEYKTQGIKTIEDLLYYFPYRYEDRRKPIPLNKLKPGTFSLVQVRVLSANLRRLRSRMSIFETLLEGEGGQIISVWFNQPYLAQQIKKGASLWLYGKVAYKPNTAILQMNSPDFEVMHSDDMDSIHTGRIVPVYRRIKGAGTKSLRRVIYNALFEREIEIPEIIPPTLLRKQDLPEREKALKRIHFPDDSDTVAAFNKGESRFHHRFIYEELLMMQSSLHLIRSKRRLEKGIRFTISENIKGELLSLPPFRLTKAQEKVLVELLADMASAFPMNRLLQGDVGSGKTIVALLAALAAVRSGYQVAIMAPTEILAEQHYKTAASIFSKEDVETLLLTSNRLKEEGKSLYDEISEGKTGIVVGTHALIQTGVSFKKLGLVIVDEQHRFGVDQRKLLAEKGTRPDKLFMTATPIPRSLSLTAFGSLDLTVLDQMPAEREPVETILTTEKKRKEIYSFIREQVKGGRQAYVVYPLVESTEKSDLKAATEMSELLQKEIFPEFSIGLIHGRLDGNKKEEIMTRFAAGNINILVTTTVIEVGIDVPNASVMLIEHSERFGLSQLHQLRGRVGRGKHKSVCILMINPPASKSGEALRITDQAKERLKIMRESSDGFVIAQKDLEIRGPGEFLGTKQSGMPRLRIADVVKNYDVLFQAHADSKWFFSLPDIEGSPDYERFIEVLRFWWSENYKGQN